MAGISSKLKKNGFVGLHCHDISDYMGPMLCSLASMVCGQFSLEFVNSKKCNWPNTMR